MVEIFFARLTDKAIRRGRRAVRHLPWPPAMRVRDRPYGRTGPRSSAWESVRLGGPQPHASPLRRARDAVSVAGSDGPLHCRNHEVRGGSACSILASADRPEGKRSALSIRASSGCTDRTQRGRRCCRGRPYRAGLPQKWRGERSGPLGVVPRLVQRESVECTNPMLAGSRGARKH